MWYEPKINARLFTLIHNKVQSTTAH